MARRRSRKHRHVSNHAAVRVQDGARTDGVQAHSGKPPEGGLALQPRLWDFSKPSVARSSTRP